VEKINFIVAASEPQCLCIDAILVVVICVALLMLSITAFSHLNSQTFALVHQQLSCSSLACERMAVIFGSDGTACYRFEALPSLR
jgi:hypothetical protein